MPPFFPNQILQVERRVEASVVQAAGLANRGSEKELAPRPLRPPLGQHPCFLEEAGGRRWGNSKYIHVLALSQLAPGSLPAIPIPLLP